MQMLQTITGLGMRPKRVRQPCVVHVCTLGGWNEEEHRYIHGIPVLIAWRDRSFQIMSDRKRADPYS